MFPILFTLNNIMIMESIAKIQPITLINYADDPQIDRRTRAFLKNLNTSGGSPLESLPIREAQLELVKAQASVKVDVSGIDVSQRIITYGGYTVKIHIVRPAGIKEKLPVFIFIHGGGWVLGDYPTHERLVRDLVILSGYAAVFVNYTRTSDAPYPLAINEIYAATKWVAENGSDINVDGSQLAVLA